MGCGGSKAAPKKPESPKNEVAKKDKYEPEDKEKQYEENGASSVKDSTPKSYRKTNALKPQSPQSLPVSASTPHSQYTLFIIQHFKSCRYLNLPKLFISFS